MAPRHVCARRAAHGPWLPHLLWLLRRRRRLSHAQRGYLPRSLRRQRRSRTAPHSTPATGREGRYSTLLYAERAAKLIEDFGCRLLAAQATVGEEASATIAPASLFIYLAWQAIHSPDEAPAEFIARFADSIPDTPDGVGQHRRIVAGMVACLDEGMANVTGALRRAQLFDTTLIVFSTDNGGPAQGFNSNMASNWPLRGMKRTLWEGGLHGVSFVSGAGLHAVDDADDGNGQALRVGRYKLFLEKGPQWHGPPNDLWYESGSNPQQYSHTVDCGGPVPSPNASNYCAAPPCLSDVVGDPCEFYDLSMTNRRSCRARWRSSKVA